jgi:hypothetical protein
MYVTENSYIDIGTDWTMTGQALVKKLEEASKRIIIQEFRVYIGEELHVLSISGATRE